MLFAIFALDKPNSADKRKAVHAEHAAHLKKAADYGVTLTVGGPLIDDAGKDGIGSLMLIEAPDRAAVEKFNRADPLQAVWSQVEIRRFDKRTG
ncbi:MAG TPA: YciI family protein [Candidatus Binataceae bacterium]|nr:YciI family protein [Candidatus Binataceae bacterium]